VSEFTVREMIEDMHDFSVCGEPIPERLAQGYRITSVTLLSVGYPPMAPGRFSGDHKIVGIHGQTVAEHLEYWQHRWGLSWRLTEKILPGGTAYYQLNGQAYCEFVSGSNPFHWRLTIEPQP